MSLTAVEPDRELVDGLSLDAAWERAKDLETEVRRLRTMLKSSKAAFEGEYAKRTRLERGVREIMGDYQMSVELHDDLLSLLLGE